MSVGSSSSPDFTPDPTNRDQRLLANFAASTQVAQHWQTYAGTTTIAADGNYEVEFIFNTNFIPAKDVVIDQVYVIPGNPPIGEVPEPATLALLTVALFGIALARRAGDRRA